jgi:hypothetical protein
VRLPQIEYEPLLKFLEFIYTDTILISENNVEDLYIIADQYLVQRLKFLCENFMRNSLTVHNACQYFFLADHYNSKILRDDCLR